VRPSAKTKGPAYELQTLQVSYRDFFVEPTAWLVASVTLERFQTKDAANSSVVATVVVPAGHFATCRAKRHGCHE
jgi:hypothetical protein